MKQGGAREVAYYVVLDANVWAEERLLHSSMGNALLYALTEANALIGVPEVVQKEVNRVLAEWADEAVGKIERGHALLQQLSGKRLDYRAPTVSAVREGIENRWKELDGVLFPIPFTCQIGFGTRDEEIAAEWAE